MTNRTAEDIMTREVVTLEPETDLYEAMGVLVSRKFSGAPVVDEKGVLVGILSEKDCLRVLASEVFNGFPEGRVLDYMSRDVVTVTPSTSVFDIAGLFLNRHFRRLPVVDKHGRLVGQISRRDVLRAIESMRQPYVDPTAELAFHADREGPMGVSSAMSLARSL